MRLPSYSGQFKRDVKAVDEPFIAVSALPWSVNQPCCGNFMSAGVLLTMPAAAILSKSKTRQQV